MTLGRLWCPEPRHSTPAAVWLACVMRAFLCGLLCFAGLNCSCSHKHTELDRVQAAAKRGDPEAQFELGLYYHEGTELGPDYAAAAMWFQRAAAQGHAAAQLALGKMQLNGEGMLPDESQGTRWIQKAAEQGYAPAQEELAFMYENGIGVIQDNVEAYRWAAKAAEQDFPEAQYHLGCMLSSNSPGKIAPDLVAACTWLNLAAAEGHQESEELLATLKARLSPAQLEEVKRRAEQWKRTHSPRE